MKSLDYWIAVLEAESTIINQQVLKNVIGSICQEITHLKYQMKKFEERFPIEPEECFPIEEDQDSEDIGMKSLEELRLYLYQKQLTITEFARQLGYSEGHMGRVVRGIHKPSPRLICLIEKHSKGQVKLDDQPTSA